VASDSDLIADPSQYVKAVFDPIESIPDQLFLSARDETTASLSFAKE
jgi:hypothetical protein